MSTYLLAIFASPLYFLFEKKWGAFILNSIFYLSALFLLITFIGAFLAPLPWMIGMAHVMFDYRKKVVEQDASVMAKKMVEALRSEQINEPKI